MDRTTLVSYDNPQGIRLLDSWGHIYEFLYLLSEKRWIVEVSLSRIVYADDLKPELT